MIATCANLCWQAASSIPASAFRRALSRPQAVQDRLLAGWLHRHRDSIWGRENRFAELDPESFRSHHPVTSWEDYQSWIGRIASGEQRVLTSDPVSAFLPTSGSSGGRKLIPATASLQKSFRTAVDCWMHAVFASYPGVINGPAYWSLSPPVTTPEHKGCIPVGFADDAAYLGRFGAWLARSTLAVPPEVAQIRDPESWRTATCLHLLRCPDLRLISVWSPSFLALLWQAITDGWDRLLADPGWSAYPKRLYNLDRIVVPEPRRIWPHLELISCWTHGASREEAMRLAQSFPGIPIQPKGLVATEAVVSFPWAAGQDPVMAATATVVEFETNDGRLLGPEDAEVGSVCGVVISNGSGLWRYRLGDTVEITGRIAGTPTLRFLGRCNGVSDRRGEKLHPIAVERAIRDACTRAGLAPTFMLLAPERSERGLAYALYVEFPSAVTPEVTTYLAVAVEERLVENPHYQHCRRLGQLGALSTKVIPGPVGHCAALFHDAMVRRGMRAGDIKPLVLDQNDGWGAVFYDRQV